MAKFLKQQRTATAANRLHSFLRGAITNIQKKQPRAESFLNDAHDALETLPLATDEFTTASNRLRNALKYVEVGEWGAALYEVKQVLGWFKRRQEEIACV